MKVKKLPLEGIRSGFESLAAWHSKLFLRALPYSLLERSGEFVLADSAGKPVSPVAEASGLQKLIRLKCFACGLRSPVGELCYRCGTHPGKCCNCVAAGLKDTHEMPGLPPA